MIHTNRCKHCGKTKEEHNRLEGYPITWLCKEGMSTFKDSGLAALDAHKEELYEKAKALIECDDADNFTRHKMRALKEVLNQIEKEK